MIKVSDFGLTEDMYSSNYYRQERSWTGREEKVPIKWMAPEGIETNVFDENTDVVSQMSLVWVTLLLAYAYIVLIWIYSMCIPNFLFFVNSGHLE